MTAKPSKDFHTRLLLNRWFPINHVRDTSVKFLRKTLNGLLFNLTSGKEIE